MQLIYKLGRVLNGWKSKWFLLKTLVSKTLNEFTIHKIATTFLWQWFWCFQYVWFKYVMSSPLPPCRYLTFELNWPFHPSQFLWNDDFRTTQVWGNINFETSSFRISYNPSPPCLTACPSSNFFPISSIFLLIYSPLPYLLHFFIIFSSIISVSSSTLSLSVISFSSFLPLFLFCLLLFIFSLIFSSYIWQFPFLPLYSYQLSSSSISLLYYPSPLSSRMLRRVVGK